MGDFCDEDIDECASNPCVNDVRCINQLNDYECVCMPGWTGRNCDMGEFDVTVQRKRKQEGNYRDIIPMNPFCLGLSSLHLLYHYHCVV